MQVIHAEHPVDLLTPYEDLIEQVIVETAQQGDVVIIAHGAGIPLAKVDGALRVLVTASEASRTERIAEERSLDAKEAKRQVKESDKERERYFKRIYELNHELPTHYDLVVNTDELTKDQAAGIIVSAAKLT